uniref:Uncharacterized protein n=1 Tax=Cyanothece sp. (strain PCC 7425 / ATCC 29141) TaxID=395961 RepID=B8HWQ4_CYAP4
MTNIGSVKLNNGDVMTNIGSVKPDNGDVMTNIGSVKLNNGDVMNNIGSVIPIPSSPTDQSHLVVSHLQFTYPTTSHN